MRFLGWIPASQLIAMLGNNRWGQLMRGVCMNVIFLVWLSGYRTMYLTSSRE